MVYKITPLFLILFYFLAACANYPPAVALVTPSPSLPARIVTSSPTLVSVPPTPSSTPAASPTLTPSPTSSATLTPSPTVTILTSLTATVSDAVFGDDNSFTIRKGIPETPITPVVTLSPTVEPTATPAVPITRTLRIGLHGRNDFDFHEMDYQLVREAGVETMKMLSLTRPEVFARLKQENPQLQFIVRLYDDRINAEGHPTPQEFAGRMIPIMQEFQPYVAKFEVGNEPNHFRRYEGWGPEDADAENFNAWFLEVYDLLKAAHPWAQLGFPALGTPDKVHRDRAWLQRNREAIERADWLGVHCYWQTYPDGSTTLYDPEHGLCFTYYHELFPTKPLELTEFDNDNIIWEIPPLSEEALAAEIVAYYQELYRYPYLHSASSFIMSSPDPRWDYFTWRNEAGSFKPVVAAVAAMPRPPLAEE